MRRLPLEGVRVTDFCWIGAGSYTTKLLADLGAEVLKIESANRLDSLRLSPPFKDRVKGVNRSGYFADRNASKRSVTLNLKDPRGLELVRALIRRSDIVSNNFTPGTMERLGLGYEAVRAIRPDVIYLAMSMQGATGPEAYMAGYGLTIGAISGVQYLTGLPGHDPAGTGTNYPDHVPSPGHGAFSVLAALRQRRRTGEGQYIDISQTEATVALFGPTLMDYAVNGREAAPRGNDHLRAAPHGVYPCAGEDRWIAIAVVTDAQWRALADVLKLRADEWSLATKRYAERAVVDAAVAAATAHWDGRKLMAALQARGVPAGIVQDAADMFEDPQLHHRRHWRRLDHPEMGPMAYNSPPFRFASEEIGPHSAAPQLGQHTFEVCRDLLELDGATIAALAKDGVLT